MEPGAQSGGSDGVTADEDRVVACLDGIIDPCSAVAGHPAGLVSMGLVRHLDVRDTPEGLSVLARIGVTEPGCLMGVAFVREARERLAALPGIAEVTVDLEPVCDWLPQDMDAEYRRRREEALDRSGRSLRLPVLTARPTGRA